MFGRHWGQDGASRATRKTQLRGSRAPDGDGVFRGAGGSGNGDGDVRIDGDGELFIPTPYLSYKPKDTRIVTYALGRMDLELNGRALKPGTRQATTARVAREELKREFGQILEENAAGSFLYFRVPKKVSSTCQPQP